MPAEIRFSSVAGAPRRKNGRQQACEPCRRRKVACDHRLPVCSRCRRGRISERCVYITSEPSTIGSSSIGPLSPKSSCKSPELIKEATSTPRGDGCAGFLGATSYSAFYQDSQKPILGPEFYAPFGKSSDISQSSIQYTPHALVDLAIRTLRSVPDHASAEALIDVDSSGYDGWCQLAGKRSHASFWVAFGNCLNGDRNSESMMHVATTINENTSKPFKEDHTSPDDWLKSFSGSAMRWEALGHLFIYWAYGARGILEVSTAKRCKDLQQFGGLELMRRYKICASWCMKLSRAASSSNTLMAYLVFKHCLLESQISGEASLEFWRLHGDILSLTTFMGLHASTNTSHNDRSISVQMQRRLFFAIFSHDKTVATFTGRPPFLSRRFVSTPLPLDISDEELLDGSKTEDLQTLKVDLNGWNTKGKVYGVTFTRSRAMLAFIRDEILEIALQGQQYCVDNINTLMNLRNRAVDAMSGIPSAMTYHPEDMTCRVGYSNRSVVNKLRLRLDHLQNIFLIDRLLSKQGDQDCGCDLFDISLEMISLALILWTHQKRVDYPETCLDWLVISYAAPAGGVLCIQLLKCGTTATKKAIIIEKLSMLVSFLDWVAPSAPNYAIGRGVQHAVRRTIEQSLEAPTGGTTGAVENVNASWVADAAGDLDSIFNFDLLDTFDWLRPDVPFGTVGVGG